MVEAKEAKYLIIGNSAGGIGAAEAIRTLDSTGAVVIVSDEPYPAYSRPLISEYLAGNCSLEGMLYRPVDFYQGNNIQAILGCKVTGLDMNAHIAELANGGKIAWEKLLVATGGQPIMPKMEGIARRGVFTFGSLDDAKAIDRFLGQQARRTIRVVVIGGGLIGVSVTEALKKRKLEVVMVEMKERILNTILDAETSALAEETLQRAGVGIITGHTVSHITGYLPGEAGGVVLDNDQPVPAEMIVVAIGVQPRLDLIAGTAIEINRGIIVDNHMAASVPDVYACGDVAEGYDFVYGENRLTPVWPNAYWGGRIAGLNMAGVKAEYGGGTAVNSMKYFGMNIVSAGRVVAPDDSYESVTSRNNGNYRKLLLKDGVIAGMVFSGDIEQSGIIYHLMKEKVNVSGFKRALVSDDFCLASLPEENWRPIITLPDSIVASRIPVAAQPAGMFAGE